MGEKIILQAVPVDQKNLFFSSIYGSFEEKERGCIGHLRGDFGRSGTEFWTSWCDHNKEWNTPDFKEDIDRVVNELREDGLLNDLPSMCKTCRDTPEAMIHDSLRDWHGFRCDSGQFSYYIRAMTQPGDYNFYVYCYQRDTLEQYLNAASQQKPEQTGMNMQL